MWRILGISSSVVKLQKIVGNMQWFKAQTHVENENSSVPLISWSPPVEGSLKCNVDAGFNTRRGTTNRGWCFRDHLGSFLCGGTAWDFGSFSIMEAEALAIKEAILSAIDLHMENLVFESDSQRTIQAILSDRHGVSDFSLIVSSIRNLLFYFPNFEVKFVKHQANSVTHSLAKAADSWTRRSWFNVLPPCIATLLINDMS
ncbi:uncharacterized protein LOC131658078 [Vicia villosa]|uniref:uncharacterized protein LOC131658078 n=1 Tax=Vicia villosa TaxID=3911 RepID=UPI00273A8E68|nr:uncharacterized protein LOC131658078 [Vicia villosa]